MREKRLICFLLSSTQFKSTSSKSGCVVGLMAMMADDPEHPDVFLLTDSEHGEKNTHTHTHTHIKGKRHGNDQYKQEVVPLKTDEKVKWVNEDWFEW